MMVIEYDDKGRSNIGDLLMTLIDKKIKEGWLEKEVNPLFGEPNWIKLTKGK